MPRDASTTTATTQGTSVEGSTGPHLPDVQLAAGEWVGGRYRVEALIGRGGFGEVYRVIDTHHDDRAVALKLHRARDLSRGAMEALRSEFGLLSTLSHPNLADVHDFTYVPGDYAYFTQALVEGAPLHTAGVDPTTARGAGLLVQLCRALDYLHARGIVHGDIKPSNVLVDPVNERLTLLDFGVARALGGDREGPLVGSPPYMAPELVTGGGVDARADLYALGITLYLLVAGAPPFRGPKQRVLVMQVEESPPDLPHSVPIALRALVARLLAKDPDERPPSAAHVLADLARIGGLHAPLDTDETLASHLLSAPVVGRVGELFELSTRAERSVGGQRPVLLTGGPGAGKSRLVRELRRRVQLRGQPWVQVEARRGRDDVLQRLARAVLDRARREGLTDEARLELARALPELRRPRERIALPIDPTRALERRLVALSEVVAARFADVPGVVAVEDLHWANPREVESLRSLVQHTRAAGARVLFLLTARAAESEPLVSAFDADRMDCRPLGPRVARQLLEAVFADASVLEGSALGAHLERGPVSALWLQESLRDALERGRLVRRASRFERSGEVEAAPLDDVLASRIGRRTSPARRLALGLAVFDEPQTAHGLVRVSGLGRRRALEALAELVSAGVVERGTEGGHARYAMQERYANALLAHASARSIRATRRRVGQWLATRRGVDFRGLAHASRELELAGDRDGAVSALARAADLAEAEGRPEHAARLLSREVALRGVDDPTRVRRLIRLYDLAARSGLEQHAGVALMELADVAVERPEEPLALAVGIRGARQALRDGDLRGARAACAQVLAGCERGGHAPLACEVSVVFAEVEQALGEVEHALTRYLDAADRARALARFDLEATASLGAAILHVRRGDQRGATEAAGRAVHAADRARDPLLRAEAHRALGNARLLDARRRLAMASYRASVRVARASGGMVSEAKALNNLGAVALSLGRAGQALEAWERAIGLKERAGAIPSAMVTWASMTGAQLLFGQREAARRGQQRVIESPRTDHPIAMAVAWSNRGDLELLEGHLDAAIEAYDRGASGHLALEMSHLATHGLCGGARARLMRAGPGDVDAAEAILLELDRIVAKTGVPNDRRRATTTRALVLDARGELAGALEHARLGAAIEAADGVYEDALASVVEAAWIVAVLLRRAGRATKRALRRARRRLEVRVERLDPPLRAAFVEQHPLHRGIRAELLDVPPGTTWR